MESVIHEKMHRFFDVLGLDDEPLGMFYTDTKPAEGLCPKPGELPTREKEQGDAVDWGAVFGNFSCIMGHIWRARRKKTAAWFSPEHFGCPGGAFWLGFMKPQTETIIHYVSSGVPERMEGELYCDTPDHLRAVFEDIDPPAASGRFCVFKPLSLFAADEFPEFVTFFARPEVISGLHQLAFFVTNDSEIVASPWGAACTSIVTWPLKYRAQGKTKAVIGGWDISARKFFKTDEISFTVPKDLFGEMLRRREESFLKLKNWEGIRKKIDKSRKAWNIPTA